MRDKLASFTVDRDGRRVRFGLKYGGEDPVLFDLAARTLEPSSTVLSGLTPPRITGLPVTDWEDKTVPKLGGTALPLTPDEKSRSLAISPTADRFLLGTEWSFRLFDKAGRQLWEQSAPGPAWGVNVSGDGRLAVAAYGDGTIRWHRMTDGKELLALFVHATDRRWVAWTPSGYYMASAGGEDLIGWHVNNGKDAAADFFGAGRFRDTFNRPDVVERILTTLDEGQALKQADQAANRRRQDDDIRRKLPAVVEILSPAPGSGFSGQTVEVRYRVRSPSGLPVTRVRVLIDGQAPAEAARALGRIPGEGNVYSFNAPLPARDVTLGLVAETEHGAGEVASLPLKWTGRATVDPTKPKLYALLVGVSNYARAEDRLNYAAKDAEDLRRALEKQQGGLYREVVVKVLADAVKNDVLDGLEWLERQVTARDVGLLFLSGHGLNDQQGEYWFIPQDGDRDRLRRTSVNQAEIKGALKRLAGKTLLFLDTCHAGTVAGSLLKGTTDVSGFVNELASAENGVVVYASSTGRELSIENSAWRNGAFTKALVEALGDGKADGNRDGVVTLAELDVYLSEKVKDLTGGRQHPVMVKAGAIRDYPIGTAGR
ncbi:hypothetical protein J2847_003345 [Azospirillum agricola]|uniref:caspase family protein n=1 Tax=Azospirillum agricola TaxID=1720247 RepID=UPI001AE3705B|nr:caspase family protein [Azospirillum agricola]MBP2230042.1 hypothetical protein [Azospirillum agricola]